MALLWFAARGGAHLLHRSLYGPQGGQAFHAAMPRMSANDRILIIVPHPDDETLGCGGLIQEAVRAGAALRIVFATNGDGFRPAVERQCRTTSTTPGDFLRFGRLRMEEARSAAAAMGLQPHNLRFLGFPDGGLTLLWRYHWRGSLQARYTLATTVPYQEAVRPGAPYEAAELMDQIREQIEEFRPTALFTVHPSDDHADHASLYAFVMAAVSGVQGDGVFAREGCRLYTFVIHRGRWPRPQGRHPEEPLAPPAEMVGLETRWAALKLQREEVSRKLRAIQLHESQINIMGRFLLSFARTNEVFGTMQIPVLYPRAAEARGGSFTGVPVILQDPARDNIFRRMSPGADIRYVRCYQHGGALRVAVDTWDKPNAAIHARAHIRWLDGEGRSGFAELRTWGTREKPRPWPLLRVASGFEGECAAPWLAEAETLFVDVETKAAGFTVDRTGPRMILVRDEDR